MEITPELLTKLESLLLPLEREIMKLRLGHGEEKSLSVQEIALRMDLSLERVKQLQFSALRKLKSKEINEEVFIKSLFETRPSKARGRLRTSRAQIQVKTDRRPQVELVSVWFKEPVSGLDAIDGQQISSTRLWIDATWAKIDGDRTIFLNDDGVVAGSWPTKLLSSIQWPTGERIKPSNENFKNRMAEIKSIYPRAWTKWSADEDQDLRDEFNASTDFDKICQKHERASGGIASRLLKLDLVPQELKKWQVIQFMKNR